MFRLNSINPIKIYRTILSNKNNILLKDAYRFNKFISKLIDIITLSLDILYYKICKLLYFNKNMIYNHHYQFNQALGLPDSYSWLLFYYL